MALGQLAASAGKSLIGYADRAIIAIIDERTQEDIRVDEGSTRGTAGFSRMSMGHHEEGAKKLFVVQFNPNELSVSAQGGGRAQITDPTGNKGITFEPMPPRIQVDVPLIFDNVYNQDAFMSDKFTLGATNLAKGAASAITRQSSDYTIRTQVEGFIAALRNERTRKVAFTWSSLCYEGLLNSLDTTYTMFNPDGEPIRAVVNMTILCLEREIMMLAPETMNPWRDMYQELFLNDSSSSYVHTAQKVGNLLNISF